MYDKKMSNNYDRLDRNDDNMKLHRQRELFKVEKWKIYGYSTKLQVEPWRYRVSGEKYIKEASTRITSTSRTSNGVHKVHPSNDVKYESQKEKN